MSTVFSEAKYETITAVTWQLNPNTNLAYKKWLPLLFLFIIAMTIATVLLCKIVWNELYPVIHIITPDSKTLALFENYLDIKLPESIQRISTCENYEAGGREWGTYFVLKEEDVDKMIDHGKWDLLSLETGGDLGFQLKFSLRYDLWNSTVPWWNPQPENKLAFYARNQNLRGYGHNMDMFIEKAIQGWTRVFIILYADDKYFPSPVGKLFAEQSYQDILIGAKYQEIEKIFKDNKLGI